MKRREKKESEREREKVKVSIESESHWLKKQEEWRRLQREKQNRLLEREVVRKNKQLDKEKTSE